MIQLGTKFIRVADGREVVVASIQDELTPYTLVTYRIVGTAYISKEILLEDFLTNFMETTNGS